MNFRPFDYSDADYQTYLRLNNRVYPDRPRTVEDIRHFEATKGPDEVSKTFFLEQGGQSLGWFAFMTPRSNPAPGQLEVEWGLLPGYELCHELWAELRRQVAAYPAKELVTRVREDWPQADFYQSKGFVVYDRMWASQLDLETFDPPFERPLSPGIGVVTLADLDYQREPVQCRYYELMVALLRDVPFTQPLENWPFELWQQRVMKDSKLIPQAHCLALDGETMVGVSQLWQASRPHTIQTGLTGTLASHRRMGIARHLKLKAAEYAKAQGYRYIRTSNHQVNRPMLAINEALGFVREPAWIFLKKELV